MAALEYSQQLKSKVSHSSSYHCVCACCDACVLRNADPPRTMQPAPHQVHTQPTHAFLGVGKARRHLCSSPAPTPCKVLHSHPQRKRWPERAAQGQDNSILIGFGTSQEQPSLCPGCRCKWLLRQPNQQHHTCLELTPCTGPGWLLK
jgi:hypothetical protein